jgi:hypothetical protein
VIGFNKMKTTILLCVLATGLGVSCGKKSDNFTSIGNGFGYVTHVSGFTDRSLSEGLWYQDSTGKRNRVWPYLQMVWGDNIQITNNIAILVGGVASTYKDGQERLSDRLIAYEAPTGPPMDITDQILQRYCAQSGVAFTNVTKDSFVSLIKTNDDVQIEFGIVKRNERGPGDITAHDATMIISWHDIEAIMSDVKTTGKLKKENQSDFEYLQKD